MVARAGTLPSGDLCSKGAVSDPYTDLSGDTNGDEKLTLLDAFILLNYMFANGEPPVPLCESAAPASPFTDEEVLVLKDLLQYVEIVDVSYEDADDPTLTYKTVRFHDVNLQVV